MTSAYLSVISHDDQLHILGRGLDMAFMLQRASKERWSMGTGGQKGYRNDKERGVKGKERTDVNRTHLRASLWKRTALI